MVEALASRGFISRQCQTNGTATVRKAGFSMISRSAQYSVSPSSLLLFVRDSRSPCGAAFCDLRTALIRSPCCVASVMNSLDGCQAQSSLHPNVLVQQLLPLAQALGGP